MYAKIKRIAKQVQQRWPKRCFQVRAYRHCCLGCGYFERRSVFVNPSSHCPHCQQELEWAQGVLQVERYLLGVAVVPHEATFEVVARQPHWEESPVWLE